MKNRPQYAIDSVDHALHLAQLLAMEGSLGVSEAAERLGVAASTAHRLLAMLVYRDFAAQGPDRRYRAGSVMRSAIVDDLPFTTLRRCAVPELTRLVEVVNESAHLVVLSGPDVRFVHTVECAQPVRVGDRAGKTLPAHRTSAGTAMLSRLATAEVEVVIDELEVDERRRLRRQLGAVRRNGFALNHQRTETGLSAIGVVVDCAKPAHVGISLAMPTTRFRRDAVGAWVAELKACATRIEAAWAAASSR